LQRRKKQAKISPSGSGTERKKEGKKRKKKREVCEKRKDNIERKKAQTVTFGGPGDDPKENPKTAAGAIAKPPRPR